MSDVPRFVVADCYLVRCCVVAAGAGNGYIQCQCSISRRYQSAVAKCLFWECLVLFNSHDGMSGEKSHILYRGQIGGGNQRNTCEHIAYLPIIADNKLSLSK